MKRRQFVKLVALPLLSSGCAPMERTVVTQPRTFRRVRRGEPNWPDQASWDRLRESLQGRLINLQSPLTACESEPAGQSCVYALKGLKNPYYIGDQPALTQTSGWVDAWTSTPSVYAVAAETTADVVAAVNFARDHRLRLVVKGGAHSYQGTSCSADSLLVWTRRMRDVTLHEAFVPHGCAGAVSPQPAVTIGAGAIWMHVYDEVTTRGGRYVQGGGCATVGVAGLIQSGGFGSFSKRFGLAAAALLEAEVVTADGVVRLVNACTEPELFWAVKGGGGGSFGVLTRVTLRTRELPESFGGVFGSVSATSDEAFRRVVGRLVSFYRERLFNPHWGEQLRFHSRNVVSIRMVFQGLSQDEATEVWRPFREWVENTPADVVWQEPLSITAVPARHFWNPVFLRQNLPQFIAVDDRPGAPADNISWAGDSEEVGQFLHGYRSAWLRASLLEESSQAALTDAIVSASRHWDVALHFNKGLAGAFAEERAAAADTAINPAVLEAFALAIIAGGGASAFPNIPGAGPDLQSARKRAQAIDRAMDALSTVVAQPASYVSESNFFEPEWQQAFWGSNYPRLAAVKTRYDPEGLFFVHHGVGSEHWSVDGFTRLTGPRSW